MQVCAWRLDATGTRRLPHEFTDGELIEIEGGAARLAVMDLGAGLPSTILGATGADVLTWAHEADAAGFASLGTLDRVVYGNHETIPTLAAAAAVTSRPAHHRHPDRAFPGQRHPAGQATGQHRQLLRWPAHRRHRARWPLG
ncbi:hypothetical protein [Pseudonocardia sp.]|uniref:hypothetical protein n=1 Tax=Pseudonocardia sp. TaxID=60912 RepID=UPI002F400503